MPWLSTQSHPLPAEDLLTWTFDHCSYDKNKPIYIDLHNPTRTLSWNQSHQLVRRLIAGLQAWGLQPGDCVSVSAFNDINYPMLFLAIVGAGGIFSGMNPAYTPYEIKHHVQKAKVKYVIAEPELLKNFEGSVSRERILGFDVQSKGKGEYKSWKWLLGHGEEDWVRFSGVEKCKSTGVARLTTSGTTGPPKMAVQSHYNATSWFTMAHEIRQPPWEIATIIPLPLFHVATVPSAHCGPLRKGHPAYIMRRFDLSTYLSSIEKYRIPVLGLVPPLVIAIINSPLTKKYSLKSVRRIGCGAAPLDKNSGERLKALCAEDCTFTQVLGSTETTGVFTLFYYPDEDDTGSVGNTWFPNSDVKLIDSSGNDITAFDTPGELCVRGPSIIPEYFENPQANAESWDAEGYFKTGDIVYCDSQTKKWYILDRKKELIKVRGFQVAPPELEGVLLSHPNIVDAAVIGLKGAPERPRAYVVRRPGSQVAEEEVKDLIKKTLASYKQLTGGVVFLDEIPKSASGKILKRVLREEADKEFAAGVGYMRPKL